MNNAFKARNVIKKIGMSKLLDHLNKGLPEIIKARRIKRIFQHQQDKQIIMSVYLENK